MQKDKALLDNIVVLVKIQLYRQNLTVCCFYFEAYSLLGVLRFASLFTLNEILLLFFERLCFLFSPFTKFFKSNRSFTIKQKRYNNLGRPSYFVAGHYNNKEEIYRWFVGFSDVESSFGIFPLLNNKKNQG